MLAKRSMFLISQRKSRLLVNVISTVLRTYDKSSHVQWIASDQKITSSSFFHTKASVLQNLQNVQNANKKLNATKGIQDNISALRIKNRSLRKKKIVLEDDETPPAGFWNMKALATAEEYDLEALMHGLLQQNLYIPTEIRSSNNPLPDAIQAVAKYEIGSEAREIYFFREGTTVMWNITDLECSNLLQFLKKFEQNSYASNLVQAEGELVHYTYTNDDKKSYLKEGDIFLSPEAALDKFTFSNAISQSVKLGIWEASLDNYVDSIEFITEDLKTGKKIRMTRQAVLRKQGELFALRHMINLSSDLLDTPDFYWERDDLESLYQQTCSYFSISKRTRIMNEKLNHCVELVELLSSHLSDRHHIRLEWMIIVLIMVEVGFETLHYIDRYLAKQESEESVEIQPIIQYHNIQ